MTRSLQFVSLALLLTLVPPAFPATPATTEEAPNSTADAMRAAASMVGRWEGGGTVRRGPGEPEKFVGEEKVEARLDGQLLLIEGNHWNPDRTRLVHQAFAVLSYDAEAKSYRFRTHLPGGKGGDYPFSVQDGALVWEIPSAKVRYRITIEGDQWREVGTIERDGKPVEFFEMTLKRVAP
jgi:hypothetical protein